MPSVFSWLLVRPSLSQSAEFQAELGVSVWLARTKEQLSLGSVPSVTSFPFLTPSPSQSRSFQAEVRVAVRVAL
ncbi:MAG: hypothetical protein FJZ78_06905 [Bacteroidetes bacterium]|nr:hypothetical protein [Bacteroidota bacterium]